MNGSLTKGVCGIEAGTEWARLIVAITGRF
jgi:hypothetical protein